MAKDVEKKRKRGLKMIDDKEFDKKFDNFENIDKFVDYNNKMDKKDLDKLLTQTIKIDISDSMKKQILLKSKQIGLNFEDTIRALLAKEVGLI